jgi:hypothetical protein
MQKLICEVNLLNEKVKRIQPAETCRLRTNKVTACRVSSSLISFGLLSVVCQDICSPLLLLCILFNLLVHTKPTVSSHVAIVFEELPPPPKKKGIPYEMAVLRLLKSSQFHIFFFDIGLNKILGPLKIQ